MLTENGVVFIYKADALNPLMEKNKKKKNVESIVGKAVLNFFMRVGGEVKVDGSHTLRNGSDSQKTVINDKRHAWQIARVLLSVC